MRIGYARVSTSDQSFTLQHDALEQSGCTKVFQEVASGAKTARPALTAALEYIRAGDTLVVWRLDRLGRSLGPLITIRAVDYVDAGLTEPADWLPQPRGSD